MQHGSEVHCVEVTIEKLGETIAGDTASTDLTEMAVGKCKHTSGCSPKKCCTVGQGGKCWCDNCCIA